MKIIEEFKSFAVKGNMVDMAVGIIIGGAFGKIVSSLVSDIIMPPLGVIIGGVNFSGLKVVLRDAYTDASGKAFEAVSVNYGSFIQATVDFLIIAFAIFMMIKLMNRLRTKEEAAPAPKPEPSNEEKLLSEIRDILKNQQK